MSSLQAYLGIQLPIIQAPMAGSQGSALAISVCEAGGLGSLPCAMLSVEAMRRELSAIREQTAKPFNVNFFCHQPPAHQPEREAAWLRKLRPYYQEFGLDPGSASSGAGRTPFSHEAAEVVEEFRPPVVSFHFGLPSAELVSRVRATGARILSSATTVEEAVWLEDHGVDLIVAQGLEAGGHRGLFLSNDLTQQVGTFALLPQVVAAVKVPVVAAGGIATAGGVTAALGLGAAGVQIGTAYLLCPEATISAPHRTALQSTNSRHTALTNVFTGRPARGIVNRIMTELGPMSAEAPDFPLAANAVAALRTASEKRNSGDFLPLWAGQNATGCREVSAGQLTRQLAGMA